MKKIIILIICLFSLTGCNNYIELEELGIVSSIYIDNTDIYYVEIEIINDNKKDILYGQGSTIIEALNNANITTEKDIYFNHLKSIIITKNVNIKEIIYYFLRDIKVSNNFYIVISDESPYTNNDIIGEKTSKLLSQLNFLDFFDITKYYLKNNEIFLPYLEDNRLTSVIYINNDEYTDLKDDNYEIYKLLNKLNNSTLKIPCDNNYFELEFYDNNYKNNKLSTSATIKEYTCDFNIYDNENIIKLKNISEKYLKEKLNNYFKYFNNKYNKNIDINVEINKKGLLLK